MNTDGTKSLHAVIYQEDGQWIAVCLEHYILAISSSLPGLMSKIREAVTASLVISSERGEAPFEGIPRSPQRYWDLYDQATPCSMDDSPAPDPSMPPLELRTASRKAA